MSQFTEHGIAILNQLAGETAIRRRSSLTGVVEFELPGSHGGFSGLLVGSEQARRFSCIVKHPDAIPDGVRPELMLLCFLVNASLDLGQLEFTHNGGELIAKVTQCLLPDQECNPAIIRESIETAIRLMRDHADSIRSVINGDMKAANAFHTGRFMAHGGGLEPLDISEFKDGN